MIFKQISWQTFLLFAGVFTMLWYLIVWYFFYRKKLASQTNSLPHKWDRQVDVLDDNILGIANEEIGANVLEAENFGFWNGDKLDQLGPVADFQREISLANRALEVEMAGKAQVLERYREITARYQLPNESITSLREFVRDSTAIFLDDEELDNIGLEIHAND